jgi:hypothetical protein
MNLPRLDAVLSAINCINNEDPNTIIFNDITYAKEYIYGIQMSETLEKYWPDANEFLKIAVRAQHIKRWHLKRNEFDEGKTGYFKWRKALGKFHAQLAHNIMLKHQYTALEAEKTAAIIRKESFKSNSDSQALEDVACLVFLQYYFDDFAEKFIAKDNEAKIIRIVQKTWGKMSPKAHKIALSLTLPEHLAHLVNKALA